MVDLPFEPNWASPPGDTIEDALEELGLTQKELAERMGVSKKHVNLLINGRANITAETAVMLESVLGEPASFWMKRDADYRIALARQEALERAKAHADWLQVIPYAEMARLGWVRKVTHTGEKVVEALNFFGVSSVEVWRRRTAGLCPAFRDSGTFERKEGAVAAWVRKAEMEAQNIAVSPFDMAALKERLGIIRTLTLQSDPGIFVPQLVETCKACGIAVVLVPAPKGCPVSGATWWLTSDKALLALSLRHKSNDHLWFSLFHELGHLVKHKKRMRFIEGVGGLDPELEEEANRFAANQLIPPSAGYAEFARGTLSATRIRTFAEKVGIAPGIVVGRLQKDGLLDWKSPLNKLKVRYAWADE